MNSQSYKNAFTEVYTILEYLEDDEYIKIPKTLIETIEKNRNIEYEYELDETLELYEQKMLPETKAILFNIFRDYLCTPTQKESIKRIQQEERERNEQKKNLQYSKNMQFEAIKFENPKVQEKMEISVEIQKENMLFKIINKLKKLFKYGK